GAAAETTELLRHRFDHLFFTGSSTVGRLVGKAAMEHLAGVTLELGGKSPAIVHHDVADLGPAAMRIMWSKLTTAGQTCVATDYVMVHRLVKDRFVQLCKNFIENAYTRTPHKSPDYARIINRRHWQRIMDLLSATNGTVLQVCDDRPDQNDRYIPPTLVDNVAFDDPLMVDELFAPVLPIITYDSLDEVLQFVNSRDQPLALYAFGSSKTTEFIFTNTRSGTAVANETMFVSAASNFPFGGVGASGIGRYMGKASFDTFSNHRTVLQAPLALPPPAIDSVRSPPFTGPENEWKQDAAGVAFPQNYWLRTTVLGKMFTFVPLWRLIDSVSTLASGLKYGRDMTKDNTDNV
ncbi:aldehyde dehydrogenase 3, member A2, partial [Linderina pennispora]